MSKDHPVERMNLEWQNICCAYGVSHGKVQILHDIWGKAAAGEMQVRQHTAALYRCRGTPQPQHQGCTSLLP
jgi:hypothetical protein